MPAGTLKHLVEHSLRPYLCCTGKNVLHTLLCTNAYIVIHWSEIVSAYPVTRNMQTFHDLVVRQTILALIS